MNEENSFRKILTSNTWQENLNAWYFKDEEILIKQFANDKIIRRIEYSIGKSLDGRFIIMTSRDVFGKLYVTVNYTNPLPKLLMESDRPSLKFIELIAFNGFSNEERSIIEKSVSRLRTRFSEVKQSFTSGFPDYEQKLKAIDRRIEGLEGVIHTTIHLATNFIAYYENIQKDIKSIDVELVKIQENK
jgi:hypothetical protein